MNPCFPGDSIMVHQVDRMALEQEVDGTSHQVGQVVAQPRLSSSDSHFVFHVFSDGSAIRKFSGKLELAESILLLGVSQCLIGADDRLGFCQGQDPFLAIHTCFIWQRFDPHSEKHKGYSKGQETTPQDINVNLLAFDYKFPKNSFTYIFI